MTALDAALGYSRAGLSVVPIKPNGTKSTALDSWSEFQTRPATEAELRSWYAGAGLGHGAAIVTGAVSELEVLDFDDVERFEQWRELVESLAGEAMLLVCLVASPRERGGRHVYMRRPSPARNQKLARRPKLNADGNVERDKKGNPRAETTIKARGEGGYFAYYEVDIHDGVEKLVLPHVAASILRSYRTFSGAQFGVTRRPFRFAPCEGVSRREIKANWKAFLRSMINVARSADELEVVP